MFGRKKMYKKGMEDAMRAYEQFGKKQEAALEKIREEVRNGNKKLEDMISELGEDINNVYEFLTDKEKVALYNLCTPKDIKDLGDSERRMLLAILYQLAENEGAWGLTDYQKKYIRSVQRYLEITNPQTSIELSVVENVDSLDDQKAILQSVLEFFYLQDTNELSDDQEEFLEYFCINKKQAQQIELYVSKLYNTVGSEGLCEKYGFVPEGGEKYASASSSEQNSKYTCYTDLKINAIRCWEDDSILIEPRYNPEFDLTHQIEDKLLWGSIVNGEKVYRITDIESGKEILEIRESDGLELCAVSNNSFCTNRRGTIIIKDFNNSEILNIPLELKEDVPLAYIAFIYDRYFACTYSGEGISIEDENSYIIAYDILTGEKIDVDCISTDEGMVCDVYSINNCLYIVISPYYNHSYDYYDIWCYDLEKRKYKWKQFKILYAPHQTLCYCGEFRLASKSGKIIYYYGIDKNKSAYIILDQETGEILKQQDFNSFSAPKELINIVNNTALMISFGYHNGEDFYCYYHAVDMNTLLDDTDEIKEIVKKAHL